MDFDYSPKVQELQASCSRFMDEHIYPTEQRYTRHRANARAGKRWTPLPIIEELKPKARAAGLWNLFLPRQSRRAATGLTNLEYAPLCEIMGRVPWAPRGVQLLGARHRQHGDASQRYGTPSTRSSGSSRCSTARSARRSR